jgi:hypothetical protein
MTAPKPMTMSSPTPRSTNKPICGRAKSRGRGPCQSTVLYANGCCRVHGGPSPSGPAHWHFATGYRSRSLPLRLAAAYADAVGDPQIIGLRHEMALVDVRLGERLARLDTGESSGRWITARAAFLAFQVASQGRDAHGMVDPLMRLDALRPAGADEAGTWGEIYQAVPLRKRLVDSESHRLKNMGQMLSTERVMSFVAAAVAPIREVVKDPAQLATIAAEVRSWLGTASWRGRGSLGLGLAVR